VISWREGRVVSRGQSWPGAAELEVDVFNTTTSAWVRCRALAYPDLVGLPEPGDLVLLNTTALDLGLGTGGYAMIVAIPGRLPDPRWAPGHLVKARYSPMQTVVLGVDEQDSPAHDVLADADDLAGMPVVVADLHSAVPAIVAGIRAAAPSAVVAYVMTDGGALPAAFSRTVAQLREEGWLAACITAGQAYGGDFDAVTVHSALLAARHVVRADVAVVAQGPGNLGTGTRWGFSGVAAGEAINAAGVLGGRPVASLRVSAGDMRPRHQGISHHSLTAYGRVAMSPADLVLPVYPDDDAWAFFAAALRGQMADLVQPFGRHHLVEVPVAGLIEALRACPVRLSTMGRGLDEDEPAFVAAAAAGHHAGALTIAPPQAPNSGDHAR